MGRRGTQYTINLSLQESVSTRDGLAKFIYQLLFDWIVAKINSTLNCPVVELNSIGVLDIFGFEIFETNSFEQLCINYVISSLQKRFKAQTFLTIKLFNN